MFKHLLTSLSVVALLSSFSLGAEETQEETVVFEQEVEKNQVEQEESSCTQCVEEQINLGLDDTEDDDDDDTESDEYLDLKRLA